MHPSEANVNADGWFQAPAEAPVSARFTLLPPADDLERTPAFELLPPDGDSPAERPSAAVVVPTLHPAPTSAPVADEPEVDIAAFQPGGSLKRWLPHAVATVAVLGALGLFAVGISAPQRAQAEVARAEPRERPAPLPVAVPVEAAPTAVEAVAAPAPAPVVIEAAIVPEKIPAPAVQPPETVFESEPARPARRTRSSRIALPAPTVSRELAGEDKALLRIRAGAQAFERGHFLRAMQHYAAAAELAPDNADAQFGLALAAVELHRDEEAHRAVLKALRLNPAHALANLLSGYLSQTYNDPRAAREAYGRYLELDPDGQFALDTRAVLRALAVR